MATMGRSTSEKPEGSSRSATRQPKRGAAPAATHAPGGGAGTASSTTTPAKLKRGITAAQQWLLSRQDSAGWWCAELQGDATLESYIILLETFFGRRTGPRVPSLARVLRQKALPTGGWSQYPGGPADASVSCLAYLALKLAGESADTELMDAARRTILSLGGVNRANSYTKYHFAFFGQYPWQNVPSIPPEMMLLPERSPFTIYDMSSWSRTIFVPLSILYAHKPVCPIPQECGARELLAAPPEGVSGAAPGPVTWQHRLFFGVDRALKLYERLPGTATLRTRAVERAAAWMIQRFEDSDGLSAILPAMANSTLALKVLGYDESHPLLRTQLDHLYGLLVRDEASNTLRVQPCLSPVWDTLWSMVALRRSGLPAESEAMARAARWLLSKQCTKPGDWSRTNPEAPGGWYFEYNNEFYPDVDDTCMALMALQAVPLAGQEAERAAAIERGRAWMLGMQNRDGGWASFDRDNDKRWLTYVPFADHNAMVDPSTADLTARVLESLSQLPGFDPAAPAVRRGVEFLKRDQLPDGSWYGRWGVNYLYGTWQVLVGLRAIGEDLSQPYIRRAVEWLTGHQNEDGGWGETIASYDDPSVRGQGPSTPSQTAWAVLGLLAADRLAGDAVARGVAYLVRQQNAEGTWPQDDWTGTGFPRVFYLNYHYYRHYFPLLALASYASASAS
jgi:squalene-hopene/tetraprenyl-beta-curcumene cyclase